MTLSPVSRLGVVGTFVFYVNKPAFPWEPKTHRGASKAIKRKNIFVFCIFATQNSTNKLLYLFVTVCYTFFTKEILLKSTSVKEKQKHSYSPG